MAHKLPEERKTFFGVAHKQMLLMNAFLYTRLEQSQMFSLGGPEVNINASLFVLC